MSYEDQCVGPALECAGDAQLQLEFLGYRMDTYLRSKGWEHTSSTPGFIWLWKKELTTGQVVLVSRDTAIHMQEYFESLEEVPEEEEHD